MKQQPFWRHWLAGVRFYIACGIVLATVELWWWVNTEFSGSDLAAIRLQESYAWLSLVLLGTALLIGPLYKLVPTFPGKQLARDARRLFGIGAAWFASLHVAITYFGLFHGANPLTLSAQYQRPFLLGTLALVILLAMAFTSFDAAFTGMGKWWFRLHRFVYVAAALAVVHIFMIGVHATSLLSLAVLAVASLTLLAMHTSILLQQNRRPSIWQLLTIGTAILSFVLIGNYALQQYIAKHDITGGGHSHGAQ
jgi:sulfoxide reductase heme-binding subunit YedZ